jgi:hypothetical protein
MRHLTSANPEIDKESSRLEVHSHYVSRVQLIVSVRWRWLNRIADSVSEHAIAGHLNVEDVFFPISPAFWEDVLGPLSSTSQAMHDLSALCPDHAFIVGVPVEFQVFFLGQIVWYRELNLEPMRSPTRSERFANMRVSELMGRGIFEGRAREVWRRIDSELDVG